MQKTVQIAYNGQSVSLGEHMLALEGVRILDLSMLVPGAFCTMLLGDLGAEVLKIEAPVPDEFRGSSRAVPRKNNEGQQLIMPLTATKRASWST